MDLDLLRCFVAVAEQRSFTAAGARLGRSQSAVSIRIKKLETGVGGALFVRNNQDVQLTDKGRVLLPKARQLLHDSERLLAQMRGPAVSGRLRIGLLEYVAPHRLPAIMGAIQRNMPDAEVQFRIGLSSDLRAALRRGEVDLALALHAPDEATSVPVTEDRLLWIESDTGPGTSARGVLDLCLMPAPCVYRAAALDSVAQRGLAFREVVTAQSVGSVRQAVVSGAGITVLSASCLGPGLRPVRSLSALPALPSVTLSLQGADVRKAAVASVLQGVLSDHMAPAG